MLIDPRRQCCGIWIYAMNVICCMEQKFAIQGIRELLEYSGYSNTFNNSVRPPVGCDVVAHSLPAKTIAILFVIVIMHSDQIFQLFMFFLLHV